MARTLRVTDNETGRQITFTWHEDTDPTEADLEEVFAAAASFQPAEASPVEASIPRDPVQAPTIDSLQQPAPAESTRATGSEAQEVLSEQTRADERRRREDLGRAYRYGRESPLESPGSYARRVERETQETQPLRERKLVASQGARGDAEPPKRNLLDLLDFIGTEQSHLPRATRAWAQSVGNVLDIALNATGRQVERLLRDETQLEMLGRQLETATQNRAHRRAVKAAKAKPEAERTPEERLLVDGDRITEQAKQIVSAVKEQPFETVREMGLAMVGDAPAFVVGGAAARTVLSSGVSLARAGRAGRIAQRVAGSPRLGPQSALGRVAGEAGVEALGSPLVGIPLEEQRGNNYGTVEWATDLIGGTTIGGAVGAGKAVSDAIRSGNLRAQTVRYAEGVLDRMRVEGKISPEDATKAKEVLREAAVDEEVLRRRAAQAVGAQAQTDLLGGEAPVASSAPRAPEQVDLMAGQVQRQVPARRIGEGAPDAGIEGTPLQAAADAAERAQVETDLFQSTSSRRPREAAEQRMEPPPAPEEPFRPTIEEEAERISTFEGLMDDADQRAKAPRKPRARKGWTPPEPGALRENDLNERKKAEKIIRRATGERKVDPDLVTDYLRKLGDAPFPVQPRTRAPKGGILNNLPPAARKRKFFGSYAYEKIRGKGKEPVRLYEADMRTLGFVKPGTGEIDLPAARKFFGKKVEILEPGRNVRSRLAQLAHEFSEERVGVDNTVARMEEVDNAYLDIEFDPEYGLHEDDVAQAILNRPRNNVQEYEQRLDWYKKSGGEANDRYARDLENHQRELVESGELRMNESGEPVAYSPEAAAFIGADSYFDEVGNLVDAMSGEIIVESRMGELPAPRPIEEIESPIFGAGEPFTPDEAALAKARADGDVEVIAGVDVPRTAKGAEVTGNPSYLDPEGKLREAGPSPHQRETQLLREIVERTGVPEIAAMTALREAKTDAALRGAAREIAESMSAEEIARIAESRPLTSPEMVALMSHANRAETDRVIAAARLAEAELTGDATAIARARRDFELAELQTAYLLDVSSGRGSEAGRTLRARRMFLEDLKNAGLMDEDALWRRELENFGLTPLEVEQAMKIRTEDPSRFTAMVRAAWHPDMWQKIRFYYKSALLSGLATQGVNFIGNGIEGALLLAEAPLSAMSDRVLRVFDFAGKDASRTMDEAPAMMGALANSMGPNMAKALQDTKKVLSLEPRALTLDEKFEMQMNPFDGKFGQAIGLPLAFLQIFDDFYKGAWEPAAVARVSARMARNELGPDAPRAAVTARAAVIARDAVDNPGNYKALWDEVERSKKDLTFQNDAPAFVNALMEAERKGGALGALLLATVPFKKTPANIFQRAYQRSPLGAVSVAKRVRAWQRTVREAESRIRAARENKRLSPDAVQRIEREQYQRVLQARGEANDAIGRAVLGSAMFVSVIALASAGYITGAEPADRREAAALRATGWRPYSLVLPGSNGKIHIPLRRIAGPVAPLIGVAADFVQDGSKKSQHLFDRVLSSTITNLMEQSYLQGLQNFFEAIEDPDSFFVSWGTGLTTSFVPNILGTTARAIDPIQRDVTARGDNVLEKTFSRGSRVLLSRIPGASFLLEPKFDSWGNATVRDGMPGAAGAVERLVSPGVSSRHDPESVQTQLMSIGYTPSPIPIRIDVEMKKGDEKQKVELEPHEIEYLAAARREAVLSMARKMQKGWWRRKNEEKRLESVESHFRKANTEANAAVRKMVQRRLKKGSR